MRGPDAYISPGWYASKAEHGRVVPTWNYVTAHVYGRFVVHDDPVWTEDLVRRLTTKHEAYRDHPWSVDDAPRSFIDGQLRAIVGIELEITRIEAKAKLSQNRPAADVEGVIAGLRERGDKESADAVGAAPRPSPTAARPHGQAASRDIRRIYRRRGVLTGMSTDMTRLTGECRAALADQRASRRARLHRGQRVGCGERPAG